LIVEAIAVSPTVSAYRAFYRRAAHKKNPLFPRTQVAHVVSAYRAIGHVYTTRAQAMYNYDRRTAASETPIFDALVRDQAKIMAHLDKLIPKIHDATNKIENMARGSYEFDPKLFALADTATVPAYKLFEPFRPLSSFKAHDELKRLEGSNVDAAKESRNLASAFAAYSKAYNFATDSKLNKDPNNLVKHLHDLSMAASTLKTVFGQLVRVYGPHI
jgi:hypothetical protein